MLRYVASIHVGYDPDIVAQAMTQVDRDDLTVNVNIINVVHTRTSKRTSGIILLECSEQMAEKIEKLPGVKEFEAEIGFDHQ